MILSGACARCISSPEMKPRSFIIGRIYLSIVPGDIVDSMIIVAPFGQMSSMLQVAAITYEGSILFESGLNGVGTATMYILAFGHLLANRIPLEDACSNSSPSPSSSKATCPPFNFPIKLSLVSTPTTYLPKEASINAVGKRQYTLDLKHIFLSLGTSFLSFYRTVHKF